MSFLLGGVISSGTHGVPLTSVTVRSPTRLSAFQQQSSVSIDEATREHISLFVHDLATRPGRRGANVRNIDSGAGLANATLQQKLTALRLYYDYLIEEAHRFDNPVGRGRFTRGKAFGGQRERGLSLDHTTIYRWVQAYAPELEKRIRPHLSETDRSSICIAPILWPSAP
jgi:hypothetical protein